MSQIPLTPFAGSVRIYRGDRNCPRTVVIQQINLPGGGIDKFIEAVFLCPDKARLDQSSVNTATGLLADGCCIGQTLKQFINTPTTFTMIMENVTSDIFARADYFDITTGVRESEPIYINVEAF